LKHSQEKILTEGSIIKTLIYLSIPIILTNILQTAYNLTDTFWVGRLGKISVAAVSLSFPVLFIIISSGSGLAVAGSILTAQKKGAKDEQAVNHIATQTFYTVLGISILLAFAGYHLTPVLIKIMKTEPNVYAQAVTYLRISFLGLPALFIYLIFQSLMRSLGEVKLPFYIVLSTVLLNLLLDPLFIFGYADLFPPKGVAGAAIATISTQTLAAIISLYFLFTGHKGLQIKLRDFHPDFSIIKSLIKLGIPVSIEQVSRATGIFVMVMLVSGFGTVALAGYGIGSRILSFIIIPAFGIGMATSTLVGQNIGAQAYERVKKTIQYSLNIAFGILGTLGIIIFIFAEQLAELFIPNDPASIEESALFIKFLAVSFGFLGLLIVIIGAFRGAGKTKVSMLLALFSVWIIRFPLAYYLAYHSGWKETGIWFSYPFTNFITALAGIYLLIKYKWFNEK